MRYEVINANGQVIMWTDSVECVPVPDELKAISNAGYCHRINGQIIAYNKVNYAIGRTISPVYKSINMKSRKLF